ncbi:MAG: hypothetical protein HY259_10325 [Chloroflexi bacterium]|nr:hypothetical protein [Chloroflexota bacterium]
MSTYLSDVRAKVRNDLRDGGASLWSDAQLNGAIDRALDEYNAVFPKISYGDGDLSTLTNFTGTQPRVWDMSPLISGGKPLWTIFEVEQLDGAQNTPFTPRRVIPFQRRGIYLLVDDRADEPQSSWWVRLWRVEARVLSETVRDYPDVDEDTIVLGAAAYALDAKASQSPNEVGSSSLTPRDWRLMADGALAEFKRRQRVIRDREGTGVTAAPAAEG